MRKLQSKMLLSIAMNRYTRIARNRPQAHVDNEIEEKKRHVAKEQVFDILEKGSTINSLKN